jgi:hypothetical protein
MNFYFHWLIDSDRCVLFITYDNIYFKKLSMKRNLSRSNIFSVEFSMKSKFAFCDASAGAMISVVSILSWSLESSTSLFILLLQQQK